MSSLYETIRRIVQEELCSLRTAELGVVKEQHPHAADSDTDNFACTVALRNSGLLLAHVPVATARMGLAAIPAVGDLVLVHFLGGNLNAPVITGSLYNDEDRPPVNEDGQLVLHLPLGAEDGDAVKLVLRSGDDRSIELALGSGLSLTLHDDDPVVKLEVDGGKATLQIDRDGAVTVTSQADVSVETQGNLAFKGSEVTVEAQATLTLKGATVNIN